jgi:hypothetical protein
MSRYFVISQLPALPDPPDDNQAGPKPFLEVGRLQGKRKKSVCHFQSSLIQEDNVRKLLGLYRSRVVDFFFLSDGRCRLRWFYPELTTADWWQTVEVFEIYAFDPNSSTTWSKIAAVASKPLPILCTLSKVRICVRYTINHDFLCTLTCFWTVPRCCTNL